MSIKRITLSLLLSLLILIALLWNTDLSILLSVEISSLLISILFYYVMNLIMSLRLYLLLGRVNVNPPAPEIFSSHMASMLFSDITPGRVGYLAFPLFTSSVPKERALGVILAAQSTDFIVKVSGSTLALYYLIHMLPGWLLPFTYLALTIGILFASALLLLILYASWFERLVRKIPLLSILGVKILEKIVLFRGAVKNFKLLLILSTFLGIVSWIAYGLCWYWIAQSLQINSFTFLFWFLIHPLITLLSFVPLTPAGLGIQETGLALFLQVIGLDRSVAITFAILSRIIPTLSDLIGLPTLVEKGTEIFSSLK